MIVTGAAVDVGEFEAATGWHLRPEGACQGELCVPLPADAVTDGAVDVAAVADRLRMPLVRDHERNVAALGPAVLAGHQLETATAPDLVLPDLDGTPFDLATLRGQKVLIVSWAPY